MSCCTKLYIVDGIFLLTHWGRMTHICVSELTVIGSDNGLAPGRRQAIIWTNAGILLIRPLGTNISEILIGIQTFWFKKMHLKMSSAKWRPFCLGLNVLMSRPFYSRCLFLAEFEPQPIRDGPLPLPFPAFTSGYTMEQHHVNGTGMRRK